MGRVSVRSRTLRVAVVFALLGGAEQGAMWSDGRERPHAGVGQEGKPAVVSDPMCALRVVIEASVVDDQGERLTGVELWLRDTYRDTGTEQSATMIGRSAAGLILKTYCLADTRALVDWKPKGNVSLEFFAFKEGMTPAMVVHDVGAAVLLKEGNLLGVPLDQEIDWRHVTFSPRAYGIQLSLQLKRVPGHE